MIENNKKFFFRNDPLFKVGDRVETCNHCIGKVVRVDRDDIGVFIVVQLDIIPGEFAYDPCDLEQIQ